MSTHAYVQREAERLAALRAFEVLDTPAEPGFDRLTALARDLFGTEMAVVSLIDETRQWFKSKQGVDGCQTDREIAFCDHAIRGAARSVMVVPDARLDPRFRDNPSVTGEPFVRFYAGAVLTTAEGHALGTLCVFDSRPRADFGEVERGRLRQLADMVMDALEQRLITHQSERRRAQLEMAEELAGLGSWRMDVATGQLQASAGMCAIYGFDPDQPLTMARLMESIHPEDAARSAGRLARLLESGEADPGAEVRIIDSRGRLRYVVGRVRAERGADGAISALVGVVTDTTERKLAEIALAQSEARYRHLADTAPDIITESRLDGTLTYISPASTAVMGFTPMELVGHSALALMSFEDAGRMQQAMGQVLREGGDCAPQPLQCRTLTKDGREIWLESKPTVYRDPRTGRPAGFIDVLRDITGHKALEASLKAARAEAEAAASVKAEFLANMSHELRTPLTAVLGFSKLVAEQPELSEQTSGYVRRLTTAGKALLATVNDILDFSKLEAGQVEIVRIPASPAEVIGDSLALFEAAARDKGVKVLAEGLEALPASLSLDPDRLRQVLLNLVGNAVKFTQAGGVVVRAGWQDGRLSCHVIDTGAGIPQDRVRKLFQRFSQVDASSTRAHGGTGLGLAICKGLVEAMGGEIGVQSREGQGSDFWFALPAQAVDEPQAAGMAIPEGTRILLADDHRVNRELVRAILSGCEVELTEAADGLEAVAQAGSAPFDLILMDLRMPRLGGEAAALRIRAEAGPNEGVPIIGFSADTDSATPGVFDALVGKPIDAAGLLAAIADLLDEEPSREADHEAA